MLPSVETDLQTLRRRFVARHVLVKKKSPATEKRPTVGTKVSFGEWSNERSFAMPSRPTSRRRGLQDNSAGLNRVCGVH
jgi:hypothetical protein